MTSLKHIKALVIKLVMIAVVLGVILTGIYDVKLIDSLILTLILTVGAYVIGDMYIFRVVAKRDQQTVRNTTATIADLAMAFILIYFAGPALDSSVDHGDIIAGSVISAIVIAAGEFFFHKYLDRNVIEFGYSSR